MREEREREKNTESEKKMSEESDRKRRVTVSVSERESASLLRFRLDISTGSEIQVIKRCIKARKLVFSVNTNWTMILDLFCLEFMELNLVPA